MEKTHKRNVQSSYSKQDMRHSLEGLVLGSQGGGLEGRRRDLASRGEHLGFTSKLRMYGVTAHFRSEFWAYIYFEYADVRLKLPQFGGRCDSSGLLRSADR